MTVPVEQGQLLDQQAIVMFLQNIFRDDERMNVYLTYTVRTVDAKRCQSMLGTTWDS
jgi:hypothetical protein